MLSEQPEGGAEAFGIGQDFRGIYHKGNTMDLVFETWLLYIAHSLRPHWLIWAKLGERKRLHFHKTKNSCRGSFCKDKSKYILYHGLCWATSCSDPGFVIYVAVNNYGNHGF